MTMSDPLFALFRVAGLELVRRGEPLVTHGPIDRLPPWLREGPLRDAESLSRSYRGPVEGANTIDGKGLQTPIRGLSAAALMRLGLTVFFRDLGPLLPEAAAWLQTFDEALGVPDCARLSAFANAKGSGLPVHHDRFDHVLLQLQGTKTLRLRPNGYVEHPDVPSSPFGPTAPEWARAYQAGFPADARELEEGAWTSVTLEPGSALFLPAGTWHTTADQLEPCLTAVVVLQAPSRLDVLQSLLGQLAGQWPELRAKAYGLWRDEPPGEEPAGASLVDLARQVAERLSQMPADEHRRAWLAQKIAAGRPPRASFAGRFDRFLRLPHADVRLDPHSKTENTYEVLSPQSSDEEIRFRLDAGGRELLDAILATRKAFTVRQLQERFPECDGTELHAFLERLVRWGVLQPLVSSDSALLP